MLRPVSDSRTATRVVLMSTAASCAGRLTATRTRSTSRWTAALEYSMRGATWRSTFPPVTSRQARLTKLPSRLAETASSTSSPEFTCTFASRAVRRKLRSPARTITVCSRGATSSCWRRARASFALSPPTSTPPIRMPSAMRFSRLASKA